MITTHLRLPFTFDMGKLQHDLHRALEQEWIPHFNQSGYTGSWKSIALMSSNGEATNIEALSDLPEIQPTAVLKTCPYFEEILAQFPCKFESARLLNLAPGAEILPHRDYNLGYENGVFRVHIPIVTYDLVSFILNGTSLEMQAGECWYTNVNFEHSVANHSDCDRVHLVFDCVRNDWSDQLFFSLAPEESFRTPEVRLDEKTKSLMIEELRILGTPASLALLEKLLSEE